MHVEVALPAEAVAVDRLVGQREHVVASACEVAHRAVDVDRLDRIAADEVDRVQRSAPAAAGSGSRRGRRCAGRRRDRRRWGRCRPCRTPSSRRRSRRSCAGFQVCSVNSAGAVAMQLGRPSPGRTGPVRSLVDRRRPRRTMRARLGVEHVHADVAQDPQRGQVDRLDLLRRRPPPRRAVAQARLGERSLLGERCAKRGVGAGPTTPPGDRAALRTNRRLRLHARSPRRVDRIHRTNVRRLLGGSLRSRPAARWRSRRRVATSARPPGAKPSSAPGSLRSLSGCSLALPTPGRDAAPDPQGPNPPAPPARCARVRLLAGAPDAGQLSRGRCRWWQFVRAGG